MGLEKAILHHDELHVLDFRLEDSRGVDPIWAIIQALELLEFWLEHKNACDLVLRRVFFMNLVACFNDGDILLQHRFFDLGVVARAGPLELHQEILLHKWVVLGRKISEDWVCKILLDELATLLIHQLSFVKLLLFFQNLAHFENGLGNKIVFGGFHHVRELFKTFFEKFGTDLGRNSF